MPDYELDKHDELHTHAARCATGVNPKCGELLNINSDGKWELADQDDGKPAVFIAFKDAVAGRMLTGIRWAFVNTDAHGLTVGGALQLSDTPGAFEDSDGNHQIVGHVVSTDQVYLEPQLIYEVS